MRQARRGPGRGARARPARRALVPARALRPDVDQPGRAVGTVARPRRLARRGDPRGGAAHGRRARGRDRRASSRARSPPCRTPTPTTTSLLAEAMGRARARAEVLDRERRTSA
nr:hypothetical protein [Angustibacter aerolatus]